MARKVRKTIEDRIKEKRIEANWKKKCDVIGEDSKIVIENKNILVQFLEMFGKFVFVILKIIFVLFIAFLSSIGLTILLNENLRNIFLRQFIM